MVRFLTAQQVARRLGTQASVILAMRSVPGYANYRTPGGHRRFKEV